MVVIDGFITPLSRFIMSIKKILILVNVHVTTLYGLAICERDAH